MHTMPITKHKISFAHAIQGLWYALSSQPNFIVHLTLSSVVIILGIIQKINSGSWAILFLTISGGLAIELINTSLENLTDLVQPEYHLLAKQAKDTAAAAMLVYAIFAVVIAIFIFL